jgi:hypothetical protein
MKKQIHYLAIYIYTRFNIIPLSVIISLSLVHLHQMDKRITIPGLFIAFIFNLISYWIIRVFDEKRDFEFDKVYYPDRLISSGKLSLKTLEISVIAIVMLFLIIIFSFSKYLILFCSISLLLVASFQILPIQILKKNFLIYNFVLTLCGLLIIICTYWILNAPVQIALRSLVVVMSGNWLLEVTRKVGRPSLDNYLGYVSRAKYFGIVGTLISLSVIQININPIIKIGIVLFLILQVYFYLNKKPTIVPLVGLLVYLMSLVLNIIYL